MLLIVWKWFLVGMYLAGRYENVLKVMAEISEFHSIYSKCRVPTVQPGPPAPHPTVLLNAKST